MRVLPPVATYRLQLRAGFDFARATGVLEYLHALGISHVYLSPFLRAAPGSSHGYDVVDHDRVDDDLGGETAFNRFVASARRLGLSVVADVVPNHMSIASAENRWWFDVMENGPASHYAGYFDVDWEPSEVRLRNAILLPVLSDQYGRVLEAGGLVLVRDHEAFRIAYRDQRYPVAPKSLVPLLERAAARSQSAELGFIADALAGLPAATSTDRESLRRRHRDQEVLGEQLHRLLDEQPACRSAVDGVVRDVNADPNALHDVLEAQNYRLAWWRSAGRDLGYRRFFDINTLIGLRMEDPHVFEDTHRRVLEWVREGALAGLRIDHPDGLRDPAEYLRRLRAAAPDAWIVVEKILQPCEMLPDDWPVDGTTGYEFLNRVTRLFMDPRAEPALTTAYQTMTGDARDSAHVAHACRLLVLRDVLGSDVNRLAHLLVDICERHRRHRDYPRQHLAEAVCEVLAWFPVYRTYVRPASGVVRASDRASIAKACAEAARERADLDPPLFDFLRQILTLEIAGELETEFVWRFQQLSVSAMAKGLEDTAFYQDTRVVALNEVGGDPAVFSLAPDAFHAAARQTAERWPATLLATATHDSKRGEDVRARLVLLSEIPDRFADAVARWSAQAAAYRVGDWPDRHLEWLFYQTLVGAWPIDVDRMASYLAKAAHEAKQPSSWIAPNASYDRAVDTFVRGAMADTVFMADVAAFVEPLVRPGRIVSLAQTLLKLTSPGVPDIYQGTELWSYTLVDPDNRAPVDFAARARALEEVRQASPESVWCRADCGLPKLWLIQQALALRQRQADAFRSGGYEPLAATGRRAAHVVAFRRGDDVVAVVPRLVMALQTGWDDTALPLPPGRWRNICGDDGHTERVPLADLLRRFPVALLERVGAP